MYYIAKDKLDCIEYRIIHIYMFDYVIYITAPVILPQHESLYII